MDDKVAIDSRYSVWRTPKPGAVDVQCPGCGTYFYAAPYVARRFSVCSPTCRSTVAKEAAQRAYERDKKRRQRGGLVTPALKTDLEARNLTYGEHMFIERQTTAVLRRTSVARAREQHQANLAAKEAEEDALFIARLNSGSLTLEQLGPMTDKKALELARALPFTPREAERLRQRLATHVANHLDTVNEVLEGKKRWDTSQVRLFTHLLNKVMPDVSFSHHLHETVRKPLRELTREQLERIASGELEADIIDADYTETTHASHQPPEGRPPREPVAG